MYIFQTNSIKLLPSGSVKLHVYRMVIQHSSGSHIIIKINVFQMHRIKTAIYTKIHTHLSTCL